MVSMLAKKKKLLVFYFKGLLVATYHKHEALPLEPHHVKFDNSILKFCCSCFFPSWLFFWWKDLCVWFVYSCKLFFVMAF
jgi:hypothetical protein